MGGQDQLTCHLGLNTNAYLVTILSAENFTKTKQLFRQLKMRYIELMIKTNDKDFYRNFLIVSPVSNYSLKRLSGRTPYSYKNSPHSL